MYSWSYDSAGFKSLFAYIAESVGLKLCMLNLIKLKDKNSKEIYEHQNKFETHGKKQLNLLKK
jgi:hypothetical protein